MRVLKVEDSVQELGGSQINGNLALSGTLVGGFNSILNEHKAFKFYNTAPSRYFAANYNGSTHIWSASFKGGTRGGISYSFVRESSAKSNSYKSVFKYAKGTALAESVVGYYGAAENFMNGDVGNEISETVGNSLSINAGVRFGGIYGLAATAGWEGGRWITQQEWYNTFFYGKNSNIWKERNLRYGWWKNHTTIFKNLN